MTPSAASKRVSKLITSTLAWQERPGRHQLVLTNIGDVQRLLKLPTADPARTPLRIGLKLMWIAPWHAFGGTSSILKGDTTGWCDLALGVNYQILSARLRTSKTVSAVRGKTLQPSEWNNLTLLLAATMALGASKEADRLANLLINILNGNEVPLWSARPLAAFMLSLWWRVSGRATAMPDELTAQVEPYQTLVDFPASSDRLQLAIKQASDHHLRETSSNDRELLGGIFANGPFDVWPAELQAWARVERALGRTLTWPAHPLLVTPVGSLELTEPMDLPTDELLQSVTAELGDSLEW